MLVQLRPTREANVRILLVGMMAALSFGVGARCGGSAVQGVKPDSNSLLDDPFVHLSGLLSAALDLSTVEVWIDDTELIGALGLTPPFSGASGAVSIGGSPVEVSGFRAVATPSIHVDLDVSGLPAGEYEFRARAVSASSGTGHQAIRPFAVVDPFTLELDALVASGRPEPEAVSPSVELFGATLGQPVAAGPVGLADGAELRQGFVEAAEARMYGGTP